jgi:hypothetical protein
MNRPTLLSKRTFWGSWIAFIATFPAGMLMGCLLANFCFLLHSADRAESCWQAAGVFAVVHSCGFLVDGFVHTDRRPFI